MATMEEKYDAALIGILQNEGQIAKFLDVVLGFLYRRTDFYRIMHSEKDKLGFPPGVAMKLLTNIFKGYESLTAQDEIKRQKLIEERKAKATADQEKKEAAVAVALNQPAQPLLQPPKATLPQEDKELAAHSPSSEPLEVAEAQLTASSSSVRADNPEGTVADRAMDVENNDGKEDEEERLQKVFQANSESYNGAVRENYTWSQTITDTDVRIKVPEYIRKGKDVQVEIHKKHLCVKYRGKDGGWEVGVDGDLTWEVKAEDCMWTLNPGQHVHINLEKKQERWWEAVVEDEPKINTRKIDCSRPITDLDEEAQAKIEEMMFNERQKLMGLPQSHEKKTMDLLRQAWNAEGSPFKGQSFDPSAISIDPSGVVKMK